MASAHVTALRSTWRTTAEQYKTQTFRFVRLFLGVALSQVLASLATGTSPLSSFDRKAVVAFLVPVAEVAWRQLHPALTASAVDTAPGAAIVPTEVGLPPAAAVPPPAVDVPVDLTAIPQDITP